MAKPRKPKELPEYGEMAQRLEGEAASVISDYWRQYVGVAQKTASPTSGIYMNLDRVMKTQSYQELVQYDMYKEVERDPHVSAVLQSAKLNVAGMKWDIAPYVESGKTKATQEREKQAEFVKQALKYAGYFPAHLYNLMDSIGMGFSVSEIIWGVRDGMFVPVELLNRTQRRFQFDATSRTLKIRNLDNPYMGDPAPDKKFIVHRTSATWENPFGDALDQNIFWMWLFKRMVTKFWVTNLETATAPIPIVKHPASGSDKIKAEALAVAEQIRSGAYGRIPDNMEIVWAEASNMMAANVSYWEFNKFCNDEISKCINGNSLTTESSSADGHGTRALGSVHQSTQSSRDIYRAETLAATLNATLIRWIVDFNFGEDVPAPEFRFDLEEPDDLVRESEIIRNLSSAGYDIDEKELSEKFNYTLTKKVTAPVTIPPKPENIQ